MTRRTPTLLALLAAPLLLAACANTPSLRMNTPPGLAQATVLDVSQRSRASGLLVNEGFNLGGLTVDQVRHSATSSSSFSIGPLGSAKSRQTLSYSLTGTQAWRGRCELRSKDQSLDAGRGLQLQNEKAEISCSCERDGGGPAAQLQVDDGWRPARGEVTVNGQRYAIEQLRFDRSEGGLRDPQPGFVIQAPGGAAVAAVETLHPGRLWLQPPLDGASTREPLACLAAGLMLAAPR